ncbi:MAG: hypothetical protein M0P97_01700 [Candidatus Moranbacteria bacterium]|jgi:hypothetical protein|nr:hypothetical protein [Candidatus Moranbacteria bacterium]
MKKGRKIMGNQYLVFSHEHIEKMRMRMGLSLDGTVREYGEKFQKPIMEEAHRRLQKTRERLNLGGTQ